MEFVCSKCQAQYAISTERVSGKVVKIRCRECGNVIEVRGDPLLPPSPAGIGAGVGAVGGKPVEAAAMAGQTATAAVAPLSQTTATLDGRGSSTLLQERFKASFTAKKGVVGATPAMRASPGQEGGTAAAPRRTLEKEKSKADRLLELAQRSEVRALEMKEAPAWYVAIKSSPVGPVNKARIRVYMKRGELAEESLVWKEGFNDWKPLRLVPELVALLDEVRRESGALPGLLEGAESSRPAFAEASADRPGLPHEVTIEGRDDKSKILPSGAGKESHHVEVKDLQIVAAAESEAPTGGVASSQTREEPLIDDALRGFFVGRIEGQEPPFGAGALRPTFSIEMPAYWPTGVQKEPVLQRVLRSRLFLLVGGAGALLAGFGIMFGVMTFMGKKGELERGDPLASGVAEVGAAKDKDKESRGEKEGEVAGEHGDILAGLIITVDEVLEAEKLEGEAETRNPARRSKKKGAGESTFRTTVMEMPDIEEHSIADSALKKKVMQSSSSSGRSSRSGLSDEVIRATVAKNAKTIQRCYEKVLGKGMGIDEKIRVKVQVNVGTSGIVTKVRVIEISKYGNFLTPCIENGIKAWTFPRADDPSEFVFPILLTPTR